MELNGPIRVNNDRRYLEHADGTPFFYLADTAWALFQRLDRGEAARYLQDRADKGFTVIQATAVSEFDGLSVPNPDGEVPFIDADPARPKDAYFQHVDAVIDQAAAVGLRMGLLPTWGDKVGPALWGSEPEVFTPENARIYGRFLGDRYRDRPVIWVLGGDRNPTEPRYLETWRAMAEGITEGDGGRHLKTFHPQGRSSSSAFVHDEPWLDFNMIQSGHHGRDADNGAMVAADYAREPAKPTLDGEPCYEDHPVNWKPELGYFEAWDVRKAAYRALFSGACGHTYGANAIFQFWKGDAPDPKFKARRTWEEALSLPGASQLRHARVLLESRSFAGRAPDSSLVAPDTHEGTDRAYALRGEGHAFIYIPSGRAVVVDPASLDAGEIVATWYDPRTGTSTEAGRVPPDHVFTIKPPTRGPGEDWALMLDGI
ncbi:MAG TPA: glycoside hydrolase family 140 protein [Thermomicrobiales bacterium]|nr:glycoside hydrolase family 140 protein [Thermomicrobiales bacterium]